MFLRSYARARNQHKKKSRRATLQPALRKRRPTSLFRGKLAPPKGRAQMILRNCSLPGRQGRFEVHLKDGVIQAVEAAGQAAGAADHCYDAEGGLLLPGFCDAHVHLLAGAERLSGCELEGATDFQEMAKRLREYADKNPERKLLRAFGLDYLDPPLLEPERARVQLDEIVSERPLVVMSRDLHTMWANTRALEECGLMKPMPPFPRELDTPAGREGLVRDAEGLPGGELREPACYFLVEGALGSRYPRTAAEKLEALKRAVAQLNSFGITSVHHMGLAMPEGDLELLLLLLELEEKHELNLRVESSYSVVADEYMLRDVQDAAAVRDHLQAYRAGDLSAAELYGYLAERLKTLASIPRFEAQPGHEFVLRRHVGPALKRVEKRLQGEDLEKPAPKEMVTLEAVKVFLDGVIEKGTAYRSDREALPGIPNFSADDIDQVVQRADRLGLQVRAHCIGDAAVTLMLDAVSKARQTNAERDGRRGHRVRHRIEHIEMSRPEDLTRFAAEEVIPSMQPFHQRPPTTLWHKLVPEQQWATAFPWKSLAESGAAPVFGSDWPIVSCDCLRAARHAAARAPWLPGLPAQGLTIEEALSSFTSLPPVAVHREDRLGAVEPGMLADLVLLTPEPLEPQDGARVRLTICNGKIVFSRPLPVANA